MVIIQCHVSELRDVSFRVYYKIWRPLDCGIQSYKPLNDIEAGSGDYYRLYTSPTLNVWIPKMMIWISCILRLQIYIAIVWYLFVPFQGEIITMLSVILPHGDFRATFPRITWDVHPAKWKIAWRKMNYQSMDARLRYLGTTPHPGFQWQMKV